MTFDDRLCKHQTRLVLFCERVDACQFTITMANASSAVDSFSKWVQGMILRYELGKVAAVTFIKQILERTVSL